MSKNKKKSRRPFLSGNNWLSLISAQIRLDLQEQNDSLPAKIKAPKIKGYKRSTSIATSKGGEKYKQEVTFSPLGRLTEWKIFKKNKQSIKK